MTWDVQRPWGNVAVDDYIRDRTGEVWRVCAIDPNAALAEVQTGTFRCRNRAGEWVTLKPKLVAALATVVISGPDDAEADHLVTLLRDSLSARQVARQYRDEEGWRCEPWPSEHAGGSLVTYREHLELVHGMYAVDIKTFPKLVAAHAAAHDPDKPHLGKNIPHVHQ